MAQISLENTSPGGYVIKTEWRSIVWLWVLGLLAARCAVVMPQMLGKTTDLFSQTKSPVLREVAYAIGTGVLALLAQGLINYIKNRAEARAQVSAAQGMVEATYRHLLRVSPRLFREQEIERINARAGNDTRTVAQFYMGLAGTLPVAVIAVCYYGFVLVQINWKLALVLLPLSLLSGFFLLFDRQIQWLELSGRLAYDRFRTESSELLGAVDEIRQNAVFEHALKGLRHANRQSAEVELKETKLRALLTAVMPIVSAVQNGAVMFAGAALCLGFFAGSDTPLTWGNVLTFTAMAALFQEPIQRISGLILEWRMTRVCIQRVEEFWSEPQVFTSRPDAPQLPTRPTDVVYEDTTVQIPGGPRILTGLSARIEAGRHAALVGPSGCGKSTALSLLTRQHDPAEGRVRVDGKAIQDCSIESLAREIGYVSQRPFLFNTSIRNNLLFALRRPSDQTIQDREGPLDISRWPDVKTIEDIDRRLLKVIRQVGLDHDVLCKGLDNPLPTGPDHNALQQKLSATCADFRARLDDALPGVRIPFSCDRWIEGTLGENIFGPGFSCADSNRPLVCAFLRERTDAAFRGVLLAIGLRLYAEDENLAMRVADRSPELLEYLPAREQVARDPQGLPSRLEVERLPPEVHTVFWEITLDAQSPPRPTGNGSGLDRSGAELETDVLKVRLAAMQVKPWQDIWASIAKGLWLPHLSVHENLLGGRLRSDVLHSRGTADEVLAGILSEHDLLDALTLTGLEFKVGERGHFLSGGQGQKVAIARTLMKEPNLLLLDEATSALDEVSQAAITRLIEREMKERTVITISHRLVTIRNADPILVLESGRLVEQGRYTDLVARDGLFRKLAQQEGESTEPSETARPRTSADTVLHPPPRSENLQQQLARCSLFAHMNSTNLAFLARIARTVSCEQGEVIFRRGDPGEEMYIVLEGSVAFSANVDPVANVVATCGPDLAFGELALFGNGRRNLAASASTDVRMAVIERNDLLELMSSDPQVAIALLRQVSRRMVEVTELRFGPMDSPSAAKRN